MYENYLSSFSNLLNKEIKYVHDLKAFICIPKLDCNLSRITAYGDAVFDKKADLSSQLGQIVLLDDDSHNSIPVSCKSYQSRSAARSVLSAEVIAFAELLDDALAIRKQLKFVLRQPIPGHVLADSKSLLDIISK